MEGKLFKKMRPRVGESTKQSADGIQRYIETTKSNLGVLLRYSTPSPPMKDVTRKQLSEPIAIGPWRWHQLTTCPMHLAAFSFDQHAAEQSALLPSVESWPLFGAMPIASL